MYHFETRKNLLAAKNGDIRRNRLAGVLKYKEFEPWSQEHSPASRGLRHFRAKDVPMRKNKSGTLPRFEGIETGLWTAVQK